MADARHFCPDCGSIDLVIDPLVLAGAEASRNASCPNCSWQGTLSKTIGAVTSEEFWDAERIGDVLIRVIHMRAAGPLVQTLEFIGLIPRMKTAPADDIPDDKIDLHNELTQKFRDHVMRAIMEAAITAAFESSVQAREVYNKAMGVGVL